MFPVFKAQWMKDKRSPMTVIMFFTLSIVLTIVFSDSNYNPQTPVAIFSSEANGREIEEKWEPLLNNNDAFQFVITDEAVAREDVLKGKTDSAINLKENDYQIIAAAEMPSIQLVEQYVHSVFTAEALLEAAASENIEKIRSDVEVYLDNAPFKMVTESLDGGVVSQHNMGIQLLFGFTLFMAMFTIGFKVNGVMVDKVSGVWNRMILSPVTKTGMYTGHLLYSFFIGFLQLLVVLLVFTSIFQYNLGDNFGLILVIAAVYTLSTVSMAMLFTGFVKTPEQFNIVYSSVIPILPLLSGVYMPPGTISNTVLIFIADLFPLSHAMEAMMNVALFGAGWNEIALPIVLMILIGVICMGVGVNLVERRND
ncbi:ABC transporter permease [Sutcliffiella halmapala]|uniref:ABC transporter permease n=1 Tax=Sutcliffiella halmapala TaxID=79882 RepID=UPI0009959418|nr:ABC transporter permease [Sutcliffiella halmapala]